MCLEDRIYPSLHFPDPWVLQLQGCSNSSVLPTFITHSLRSLLTPKAKAIQFLLSVLLSLLIWETMCINFAIFQTLSNYSSNHEVEAPVPWSSEHLGEEGWMYWSCGFPHVAFNPWGFLAHFQREGLMLVGLKFRPAQNFAETPERKVIKIMVVEEKKEGNRRHSVDIDRSRNGKRAHPSCIFFHFHQNFCISSAENQPVVAP